MRRFALIMLVQAALAFAVVASAQQPGDKQPDKPAAPAPDDTSGPADSGAPAPKTSADADTPPPPKPPAKTQAAAPVPATLSLPAAMPPAPERQELTRPRLLAPTFPEDRYPGDGMGDQTEVELSRKEGKLPALSFAIHGYFRAPMRFSRVPRESPKAGEGAHNYRTPYLVDDDYYKSGFSYLPINERAWNETYLSVGNDKLTATVALMGSQFADNETYSTESQFGVAQGWLTYRFKPVEGLGIRVKGGAFWDRFGYLPKYDTYIFGRTHQVGGQVRAEYQISDLTFWALDGVGTHAGDVGQKQGMTLIHYAHVGASYARTVEGGLFYLKAATNDQRALSDIQDASQTVYGVDGRLNTPAGKLYVAYSTINADKVVFLAQALEVMHAHGRAVMDNYLGTQTGSNNGTGFLKNLAFQYDFSLADLVRAVTHSKQSPLPWGGDIVASVFGVRTQVDSDQTVDTSCLDVTPMPVGCTESIRASKRDGVTKWKYGADFGWRATEWAGIYLRFDRVVPDMDDSATSFRVLSPRIALFTHFLSHETIFLQFSKYTYQDAVQLRQGQVNGETKPDQKVFKLQAQITY